jgi:hypothetical protein
MRTYRSGWTVSVTVLSALAFCVATRTCGWVATLVVLVGMTSVGALFGLVWLEDAAARTRSTVRFGLWSGVGSVLLLGFTSVLGTPWPGWPLAVSVAAAAAFLAGGVAYFRRSERYFADVI